MKATGMIRRIDELGRIVIPKEIRKSYSIRVGDEIEIYAEDGGLLVMRKHSRIDDRLVSFGGVAEAIYRSLGGSVILADTDKILAVSGAYKARYEGNVLTEDIVSIVSRRRGSVLKGDNIVDIIDDDPREYTCCYVSPIVASGDLYGSLIMLADDIDITLVSAVLDSAARFLALSLES